MTTTSWNDLIEAAGAGFEALPAGDYNAQITSAESTQTSNGKLMFKCIFTVMDGPHAGRKVWNQFVVSPENPNALGYFFQHMAALGLDRAYFAQNPQPEHVAAALLSRVCRLTLGIQSQGAYAGRNEVSKVSSAGAVAQVGIATGVPQGIPAPQLTQIPMPIPQQPAASTPQPQPQVPAPAMPAPQVPQQPAMPPMPVPPQVPQAPTPQPEQPAVPVPQMPGAVANPHV